MHILAKKLNGGVSGVVRVDNIGHTHFSRDPKIADYLKTYEYVKEAIEGMDRICRELSSIGVEGLQISSSNPLSIC